jgi:hypothetical protein
MHTGAEHLVHGDLPAFAAANGWRYDTQGLPPALGESLWEQATSGVVRDRVTGEGWEAGRMTGGERRAASVEQRGGWTVTKTVSVSTPQRSLELGYLAVTLPRRMPHMILDARGNDRGLRSSLQHQPRASQRLSLEGDFDEHFRLFVPEGYEPDALYVFTPDLMALLIDETGDLDVEIRDDRLIVYRPGGFDLLDERTWQRFTAILATLGAKSWDRTVRYIDDRSAAPALVFDAGQRLNRRVPGVVWLAVGIPVGVLLILGSVAAIVLPQVLGR